MIRQIISILLQNSETLKWWFAGTKAYSYILILCHDLLFPRYKRTDVFENQVSKQKQKKQMKIEGLIWYNRWLHV